MDTKKAVLEKFPNAKIIGEVDSALIVAMGGLLYKSHIHSWDFSGSRWPEGQGTMTFKLPGNPRDGYELVLEEIDASKVRRRIEDLIRKGDLELLIQVAKVMPIRVI